MTCAFCRIKITRPLTTLNYSIYGRFFFVACFSDIPEMLTFQQRVLPEQVNTWRLLFQGQFRSYFGHTTFGHVC